MCWKDIDLILKKLEITHDFETLRNLLRKPEECHSCLSQNPDDGRSADCLCILCFQMEIKNRISYSATYLNNSQRR
jgi:hypothetical protein